jgi:signal transduction histidine kinase
VRVADAGPGMPPQALPHLFDRFYRVDASRGRKGGGAGLGLAIVRSVAEAHGGSVHAGNLPQEGACFTVELPASG